MKNALVDEEKQKGEYTEKQREEIDKLRKNLFSPLRGDPTVNNNWYLNRFLVA